MLKDFDFREKKLKVGIAIVKEGEEEFNTYIVNFRKETLKTVLITSKGYGEIDGRKKETTVFRRLIEELPGESAMKFEPISPEVFAVFNEFWVSFVSEKDGMLDRKFLFAPGSIDELNFIEIPFLDTKGVMIKQ